jgi:hypothetical protein
MADRGKQVKGQCEEGSAYGIARYISAIHEGEIHRQRRITPLIERQELVEVEVPFPEDTKWQEAGW